MSFPHYQYGLWISQAINITIVATITTTNTYQ